jgi:hypothetical protein
MHACLELKLVESITLGKTPGCFQVLGEVVDLLDGLENGSINSLVVSTVRTLGHTFCSDFRSSGTPFFSSPSPKNSPSLVFFDDLAEVKYVSFTVSGREIEEMSTFVEVAMT